MIVKELINSLLEFDMTEEIVVLNSNELDDETFSIVNVAEDEETTNIVIFTE